MTYELATQLKDAGFPQKTRRGSSYILDPRDGENTDYPSLWVSDSQPDIDAYTLIPNLSELIEACGQRFGYLFQEDGDWKAWSNGMPEVRGSTPDEAVAHLYLTLNPDKKGRSM